MVKFNRELIDRLRGILRCGDRKFKIYELASEISTVQEVKVEIPKVNYMFDMTFRYYKNDLRIYYFEVSIRSCTYQISDFGDFIPGGKIVSVILGLKIEDLDLVTAIRYAESVLQSYEYDLDYNEPLEARKKETKIEN